jgi:hypothetical protein
MSTFQRSMGPWPAAYAPAAPRGEEKVWMLLDEDREAALFALVERIERLVPAEGAHVTIAGGSQHVTVGNRLGYLRLGVELLTAGLRPLPEAEDAPPRIAPRLEGLLTSDSGRPFDLCELDESIASRPPVRSALGPLGEIMAGLLVVACFILMLVGASYVWHRVVG